MGNCRVVNYNNQTICVLGTTVGTSKTDQFQIGRYNNSIYFNSAFFPYDLNHFQIIPNHEIIYEKNSLMYKPLKKLVKDLNELNEVSSNLVILNGENNNKVEVVDYENYICVTFEKDKYNNDNIVAIPLDEKLFSIFNEFCDEVSSLEYLDYSSVKRKMLS